MSPCNNKKKVVTKQGLAAKEAMLLEQENRFEIWKAWRRSGLTVTTYLKQR